MLRRHFLPAAFDPLGSYANSIRVQARTRAFLVLSHAEIEIYLEEWAKDIARTAETLWTTSKRVTTPLAFLLATVADRVGIPQTLQGSSKDSPQRLEDAATSLFEKYYKQIRDNHGIKEKNVLSLLAPLGVPATALGTTLLPDLDTLGTIRGKHAHGSARSVQSVLDPETEYNRIKDLLRELVVLDQWFVRCKRSTR